MRLLRFEAGKDGSIYAVRHIGEQGFEEPGIRRIRIAKNQSGRVIEKTFYVTFEDMDMISHLPIRDLEELLNGKSGSRLSFGVSMFTGERTCICAPKYAERRLGL